MLRNLNTIMQETREGFNESFLGAERTLPESFKQLVSNFEGTPIEYFTHTCKLAGRSNDLNIYFPTQWFYIAAYMSDYYIALLEYKKRVFDLLQFSNLKEAETTIRPLQGDREATETLFNKRNIHTADREFIIKFLSDYKWWGGGKAIDRNDFYVSPVLSLANLVNASQSLVADLCKFFAENPDAKRILHDELEKPLHQNVQSPLARPIDEPLQLIFYGAPGTGKSYTIDRMASEERTVRTTFHPDSDYASFVGAYKPTMQSLPISYISDGLAKYARAWEKHDATEQKIIYKYVPQAFLKAYVAAWSDLSQPQYLVIEEINRGNCAQIFGDLFQLLDRNNTGCSAYAIHADEDITQFLATDDNGFANLSESQRAAISEFVLTKDSGEQLAIGNDILAGKKLLLPPNLYIWATMNTSDQSLFPIDSAFKRRWNWRYMPIDYTKKNYSFLIGDKRYSWGEFLRKINPIISELTESPDKQMGYFFAKPDTKSSPAALENDTISEEVFVNKVLFYLWTDVLKDYEAGEIFLNADTGRTYEFSDFFDTANGYLQKFIDKLALETIGPEVF